MIEIPGYNPEEAKQLQEVMNALTDANALLPIVFVTEHGNPESTIKHSRDVESDTDTYTQEKRESEKFEDLRGWVIPFEANDTHAFAIISAEDFSTSIHFINKNHLDNFDRYYSDEYSPGKRITFYTATADRIAHLHSDGVGFDLEDKMYRLVPTNPNHTIEINKLLQEALNQAKDRVLISQAAQAENSINTKGTLINFLNNLKN